MTYRLITTGVLPALATMGLATMGIVSAQVGAGAPADTGAAVARAQFTADGRVELPLGYRQWSLVGTRIKLTGINIFDGLPLKAPEISNAFVEPSAMAIHARTGRWPDGTQIVKEMSAAKTGPDCDVSTAACRTRFGDGIFQAEYDGLGMMVKDETRYPDAPGHWAYFEFGHHPEPYDPASVVRPRAQCAGCHTALAADTDFVISAGHIGLGGRP